MMSEQYISKDKKEIQYSHSVSHSTGMTSSHNIFFYKNLGTHLLPYSIFYATLSKWINASGRCVYKNEWKEKCDVEILKFFEIDICKYKNRNILQL